MSQIEAADIERIFQEVADSEATDLEELSHSVVELQPAALGYLAGCGANVLSDDGRALLIFLGLVVWRILDDAGILPEAELSDDVFDAAEAKNEKLLESLTNAAISADMSAADALMEDHPQPQLINFAEDLLLDPSDPDDLDLEQRIWIFVFLKSYLDVLT